MGCVLPLAACVGWAIARQTPAYHAALESAASELIGLRCEWRRRSTPRPGVHELSEVSLYLPGDRQPIAHADRLRTRRDGSAWRVAIDTLVLLDPRQAKALAEVLRHPTNDLAANATVRSLRIEDAEPVVYRDVTCELNRGNGSLTLAATSVSANALCTVSLPNRSAGLLELDTGDQMLPTSWFQTPLGGSPSTRFSGTIKLENGEGHASGAMRIAASHTGDGPIRATWTPATITLHETHWLQTSLTRLHAKIDVPRGGYVHRSLLDAATDSLGAKQTQRVQRELTGNSLWYDRFACEIELDADGVTLIAGCGEEDGKPIAGRIAHAVLQSQGEALLLEPREKRLPIKALLRALWPESESALPATSRAARLASRLPLE